MDSQYIINDIGEATSPELGQTAFSLAGARSALYWCELGRQAEACCENERALLMWKYALRRDPACVRASNGLGRVLLDLSRHDEAEQCFTDSLTRTPDNEYAMAMLGCVFAEQRRYDKAADVFERVVRRDPNSYVGWNNLATVYDRLGRTSKATLAHLEKNRIDRVSRQNDHFTRDRVTPRAAT
jgi:tetratricopeptide (TPR) repeat protein